MLFQPNIVIDARLGCLWFVIIKLESFEQIVSDRVRLVEFLLQRTDGKETLINVLNNIINNQYNGMIFPLIENIFNKLNVVYK